MQIHFFERWHRHYAEAAEPLPEAEARQRQEAGEPYVVVIGDEQAPFGIIEINRGFYGVSFLDDRKREYLLYNFEQVDDQRLFLKEAILREYAGEAAKPSAATAYRFQPDGTVTIESSSGAFNRSEVRETLTDVRTNWEDVPVFGSYDRLMRPERASGDPMREPGSR